MDVQVDGSAISTTPCAFFAKHTTLRVIMPPPQVTEHGVHAEDEKNAPLVHSLLPGPENEPAGQFGQAESPAEGPAVDAGQSVQTVAPEMLLKCAAAQNVHAETPFNDEYEPRGQVAHAEYEVLLTASTPNMPL
jgi:hypothetical protein